VRLAGGQDERSKIVSLTAGGETKFEKAFPLWEKAQRSMQARLGGERAAFSGSCQK
jgi:DNA-binding MarR family transcriptional regulator